VKQSTPQAHETDVVVVGAGVAGLTVALGLAGLRVTLVTKGVLGQTGATPLAQGGIAAAVAPGDSPVHHEADTLAAAAGIADPHAVHILTHEAPDAIARALAIGVKLDREPDGRLCVHREAAHGCARVVHARDATGHEVARALSSALETRSEIETFENAFVTRLLVLEGRVRGVVFRDASARVHVFLARAVVLATGGIGRAWARTTNPAEATGDGLAMAARVGARLVDLEFVQFHPTALLDKSDPLPLLTEALRGAGGLIQDEEGRRFLLDVHPSGELASRDIVARGLARHILGGHRVYLDARSIGATFPEHFPTVFEICRRSGLDPRSEPIPVTPAAHYHMGGILVDDRCRTSVPGLYACGEVACTGVHGANRLASNSLLEGLVFGQRLADHLRTTLGDTSFPPFPPQDVSDDGIDSSPADAAAIVQASRCEMWERVGLLRDAAGLARARGEIERARRRLPDGPSEASNLLLVADLITAAAQAREESRGAHYRTDHPTTVPEWQRRRVAQLPQPTATP
jgi:L-aspartate oxidase